MATRTAATVAAAVTALAAVAGAATAFPLDVRSVVRKFTSDDLPGTFQSVFKNDPKCPSSVSFGEGALSNRGVYEVPWRNIQENGSPCSGDGAMRFFPKATALNTTALAAVGFPNVQTVINGSAPAQTTLFNGLRTTDALVGYDGGAARTCGSTTYPADTFYFFISEPGTVDITINSQKTTIPPTQQGMFVASNGPVLCVLTSPKEAVISTPPVAPAASTQPAAVAPTQPAATAAPSPQSSSRPGGGAVVVPGGGNRTPTPSVAPVPSSSAAPAPAESETPTSEEDGGGEGVASPTEDEDSVCFPGDAEVLLESGKTVTMADLQVGDSVFVGGGRFSAVYVFTHRTATKPQSYVRLTTATGAAVTLTAGHYVHSPAGLVAAGAVVVGDDLILADGTPSRVVAVEAVISSGLYNPQTLAGDIVVGGIKASTYTTAVAPAVASAALAPLRGLWALGLAVPQAVVSAVEGSARWALMRMSPALGGALSVEL